MNSEPPQIDDEKKPELTVGTPPPSTGGPLQAWLELCRLPNVFTALADPLAGALLAGASWKNGPGLVLLMLASGCLYTGGIVLNDWHDIEKDRVERPDRPLPSGRVSRAWALILAVVLLALGGWLAWIAGPRSILVAGLLIAAILAYDLWFKQTPVAPAIMGVCRSLNLLMGMTLIGGGEGGAAFPVRACLILALGAYVAGITLFARRESHLGSRRVLGLGAGIACLAAMCPAALPVFFDMTVNLVGAVLVGGLLSLLGYRMSQAILTPEPENIQRAVKTAILSIILFDAASVAYTRGALATFPVLLLGVPALWAGKWLYST